MPLKDLEKQELQSQTKQNNYGKYLLMFVCATFFLDMIGQNIKPYSFSMFSALSFSVLEIMFNTGMLYFLTLWIIDITRCRGGIERPENKKVRLVVNIIFTALFLMAILSILMVFN